ncbi:hypothetical protein GCM10009425_48640 [Pseudomonas asuensis]|uniref:Uncharacterized protein n=1 Tax=Pseudomonas asuensis TaxID=1825787 RepID=A0ABQ2H4U8_9PSED|nr:hypothetical protein GCM10009425_48640 [Pseudomonas asuensis]
MVVITQAQIEPSAQKVSAANLKEELAALLAGFKLPNIRGSVHFELTPECWTLRPGFK